MYHVLLSIIYFSKKIKNFLQYFKKSTFSMQQSAGCLSCSSTNWFIVVSLITLSVYCCFTFSSHSRCKLSVYCCFTFSSHSCCTLSPLSNNIRVVKQNQTNIRIHASEGRRQWSFLTLINNYTMKPHN